MNQNICYIFAAGDFNGDIKIQDGDLIIAADAGYHHLEKLNIIPDILLGDFDTIGLVPCHPNIKQFPKEKDYTDTELAIIEGVNQGYTQFVICGAIGGKRLEHTIANISLSASYAERGYGITLTDGQYIIKSIHNSSLTFSGKEKGFISVFPAFGMAKGVTETGLKYSLENAVLDSGNPTLGVSNEFTEKKACISVMDGTLIIIWKTN